MQIYKYNLFLEKKLTNFTLYHGSPYLFNKFKERITYFSNNQNFAWEYADQKSMDRELDQSPVIYECNFTGEIFNANNNKHLKQLEKKLPNKITCYMTNFCFPHDYDKYDILELLKGNDIIEPIDYIVNANVGDEIPDPTYKHDLFIVTKKDSDYVYTIDKKNFSYHLSGASKIGVTNFGHKYKKNFKKFIEHVKSTIYKTKKYIDPEQMVGVFLNKSYRDMFNINISDNDLEIGQELYEKGRLETLKEYSEEYSKKWNIKPKKIKLDDTWRYYENDDVSDAIKKLGFCGYVAKEKSHDTYAIFQPNKNIKIKTITYEGYKFDNLDEIYKFNQINNLLYKKYKSVLSFDRQDIYKYMKQNLSIDEIVDKI